MINLSDWAVRHRSLTGFLIAVIFLAGVLAYQKLGRNEDPPFTIKEMVITAQWTGATAEELQDQVAERLERKLQDLAHLDHLQTFVRPGFAAITLTLRDDTPPALVPELWYQVRKKLDDIKPDLPNGDVKITADDEYADVYGAMFALTGADNAELVREAERVRDQLLRVPGAQKVTVSGEVPRAIHVEFSHARLATLGITAQEIAQAIARQNDVAASGMIETNDTRVPVRVAGALDGARAVADTPVAVDGKSLRLGDIADVSGGYQDPPQSEVRLDGQPAVVIAVSMAKGTNGLAFGNALRTEARRIAAGLPAGIAMQQIADQPQVIGEAVGEFLLKFGVALGVVLLVSFVSLGLRTGVIVALSVPLTLAMVFVAMDAMGIELQRISLGALILSLGLLVDDAIIAIEMMVVKLEEGLDRVKAATFAWSSTAMPMLSGTALTVAGFMPVGLANSTTGEYAGGIFWVVGLALACSWIVAVVFTPYLGVLLLPAPRKIVGHAAMYQSRAYALLRAAVRFCLHRRIAVVSATALMFILSLAAMGLVRQQFFPSSARPELIVDVTLRQGAAIGATRAAVAKLEGMLAHDPDILWTSSYIGSGPPRFFLAFNPALPNDAVATLLVVARDGAEARERVRDRLQAIAVSEAIPEARIRVSRLELGPPVGFPVNFRVIGRDLTEVRHIGDRVLAALRATPGTRDAQLAWGERAPAMRLELDQARLRQLGLSPGEVAAGLQTLLSGTTATQIRDRTKLVDVVLRAVPGERLDLDRLPDLTISTSAGALPLSQLARIVPQAEDPILWRRDRDSYLTVQADVQDGLQAPDVTAAVLPRLAPIKAALPDGYRIETGGAAEESAKANAALFAIFPIMGVTMIVLLMIQLQNLSRALLVLATAPLGIIGAVAALLVADAPFGFVALLGVIALAGMIMRNAIILVDQVRQDQQAGLDLAAAITESTVRRARPVVLTALAAMLAFIPLSLNVFWGPMAIAMIGGLAVATVLTLSFLPALYALAFRAARPGRVPLASRTTERRRLASQTLLDSRSA